MTDKLFSIESSLKITISRWTLLVCFIMPLINTIAQTPGEWTWVNGDSSMNYVGNFGTMGVPSPTNKPPGIYGGAEWTDNLGNFWIYSGDGIGSGNNLWKYNVLSNMWTWVQGSGNVSYPQPVFGQQGIANSANSPGLRWTSETWTDNSGNLWLFGGYCFSAAVGGGVAYNDLWKYDISTNMWTWMKGDSIANGTASYGVKGVESSSNKPPACYESNLTWTDSQNNLWLLDLKGCLWKYKISTNNWIWMKGDTIGTPTFGVKGVPNINNTPGNSLFAFTRWMDSNDNLWLMYSGANIH